MNFNRLRYEQLKKMGVFLLLYIVTPILGIGVAYLLGKSLHVGLGVSVGILGGIIVLLCIAYPKFGFYLNIAYVFFVCFFQRLVGVDLHIGLVPKILTLAILVGILLKKIIYRRKVWQHVNNPITYVYLMYLLYVGLEAFNPNVDSLIGWTPFFLGSIYTFLYFPIAIFVFDSKREIRFFFKFWLGLAFIAALYGCYQQWFGLPPWEYRELLSSRRNLALLYQNGFIRKYSVMTDPPSFGILMSCTGIMALCFALGNFTTKKRIGLLSIALVMILSMSYSGTRMATALIPFGLLFFGMLTIQNKKTIILLGFAFIIGVTVIFMPVYGNGVLIRIRSTFHPHKDASMQVRDLNRKRIQPYMHSHPIGGGIGTTGGEGLLDYPDHPLAGFPPDSGYLQLALEQGWIGFLLGLVLLFVVLRYGIHRYYRSNDYNERIIYAGVLTAIFCWYMAKYSQIGSGSFNNVYLYMSSLAVMVRLDSFRNVEDRTKMA